jgi:CheY-like chemotaxis protein
MADCTVELLRDHGELLVVDDEPFLRDAVAASLRFLGFDVIAAAHEGSAHAVLRQPHGLSITLTPSGQSPALAAPRGAA